MEAEARDQEKTIKYLRKTLYRYMRFMVTKIAVCLGILVVFSAFYKMDLYSKIDVNKAACYNFVCISKVAILFAISTFVACTSMIVVSHVLRQIVAGVLPQNTISLRWSYIGVVVAIMCYVWAFIIIINWKNTDWSDQMEEPCPISLELAPILFTILSISLTLGVVIAIGTMMYMSSTRKLAKESITRTVTPQDVENVEPVPYSPF